MNIGLLSVTASVYQMMRGAEMLFAALFSVVFLHRTLNKYHFGGIACCVVRPLTAVNVCKRPSFYEKCSMWVHDPVVRHTC
jgi:hypothetical protein